MERFLRLSVPTPFANKVGRKLGATLGDLEETLINTSKVNVHGLVIQGYLSEADAAQFCLEYERQVKQLTARFAVPVTNSPLINVGIPTEYIPSTGINISNDPADELS